MVSSLDRALVELQVAISLATRLPDSGKSINSKLMSVQRLILEARKTASH